MKLVMLSPGDPEQRTGGYLYNARLRDALVGLGHEVETIVVHGEWPDGPVRPVEVPAGWVVADGLLWSALVAVQPELASRTVVVVHSLLEVEGGSGVRELERRALEGVREVIATGGPTQRGLAAMGVSSTLLEPGTVRGRRMHGPRAGRLLAVGTVTPRKGLLRLLDVLEPLDLPWTLDVVGSLIRDPNEAARVAARAASFGGRVRLLGELDGVGVDAALANSDLVVHPAHYEAYGMAIAEALVRGVPVLCTPAGAAEGGGAEVVQWEAFGARLAEALTDGHLLDQWADRAWSRGTELPTWEDVAKGLLQMTNGFSADWLAMREPYDHRARSVALAEQFGAALPAAARVLDLGGGVGSGVRFLKRHCGPAEYVVVDHDPLLVQEAARRGLQTLRLDLRALELPQCDGLSVQALLDLVSWDWLDRFVALLDERRVPVLAALTVDGRVSFEPLDSDDEKVMAAFRHHQGLDRGFGPSPGWRAGAAFVERMAALGWDVHTAEADWQIPAADGPMMRTMVDGIAAAAAETHAHPEVVEAWRLRRFGALRVGHVDVLALPPG